MQRFNNGDGSDLGIKLDLSPDERDWLQRVQSRAAQVINCEVDPRATIFEIHEDIEMIRKYGWLDIDQALRKGVHLNVGKSSPEKVGTNLSPEEHIFWWGIFNGCAKVLSNEVDFLYLYGQLVHDISRLWECDGILVVTQVRNISLKVCGWGDDRDWKVLDAVASK